MKEGDPLREMQTPSPETITPLEALRAQAAETAEQPVIVHDENVEVKRQKRLAELRSELGIALPSSLEGGKEKIREGMIKEEKSGLLEKFRNASGRAKALLSGLLLISAVGCASQEPPVTVSYGSTSESYFIKDGKYVETVRHYDTKTGEELSQETTVNSPEAKAHLLKTGTEDYENISKTHTMLEDMTEHGGMELPNGRHGTTVPGSESLKNDNAVHTEVRRAYNDKGTYDVVNEITVDQNEKEMGHMTYKKGTPEYEKYMREVIEPAKEEGTLNE